MDKNGFVAIVFVLLFVSTTCNASFVYHLRKLIATEADNATATAASQGSPIGSPVNGSNTDTSTNTSSINTEKPELDKQKDAEKKPQLEKDKEMQTGNETNRNVTLPVEPKGSDKPVDEPKGLGAPIPPSGEKNGSVVDGGNVKANPTLPKPEENGSCDGSVSSCRGQKMVACIKTSKDGGIDSPIVLL